MKSFRDGCKKIADKLTALGFSADDGTDLDKILEAIDTMYNNRYTSGYNAGVSAVKANPSAYGISTGGVSKLVVRSYCTNPDPSKYTLYAMLTYHHSSGGNPHFLNSPHSKFGGIWNGISDTDINALYPPSDYNVYMYGPK